MNKKELGELIENKIRQVLKEEENYVTIMYKGQKKLIGGGVIRPFAEVEKNGKTGIIGRFDWGMHGLTYIPIRWSDGSTSSISIHNFDYDMIKRIQYRGKLYDLVD